MVITKVSYGKTYPLGNYSSERIDLEASIDNIETVEEVLQELRDKCDSIHKTNNPHLYNPHLYQEESIVSEWINSPLFQPSTTEPLPTTTISASAYVPCGEPSHPLTQEQKFLQLISLATSTKELSMYEKTANNPKYPNLKEAYDNKLKELTNG
jgi:hypothetical protein